MILKTYYKSGKIKSETKYKNGLKNGNYKLYDNNGKIILSETYKNNIRHGKRIQFGDSGEKLIEVEYKNNQIISETWKVFDSSGEVLPNNEETQFALDRFNEITFESLAL